MENLSNLLKMVVPREWLFSLMPEGATRHAHDLDRLFWFLMVTCTILFLLVVVPMILIVVRYRRKQPDQRAESQKDHNFWLESIWTFLPFIYLTVLFVWGFWQYIDMYVPPHDAMELNVIGQKWQWGVDYPKDGVSVAGVGAEIVVPVDTPVKLVMGSQDVIHSFYIPNFRVKQDVVPGRYSTLWFKADKEGVFPILCAEYCGDLHSQMLAQFRVVSLDKYKAWIEEMKAKNQNKPPFERGQDLYTSLGCVACHSLDGTVKIGPSFKDVYGKKEELEDGTIVTVDDNYISQKILTPYKQKPKKGFAPVMTAFQGRVSEADIRGLIEFIKGQTSK